eukprot:scaffold852_cov197-Alexandrium_tamarense.AAC.7
MHHYSHTHVNLTQVEEKNRSGTSVVMTCWIDTKWTVVCRVLMCCWIAMVVCLAELSKRCLSSHSYVAYTGIKVFSKALHWVDLSHNTSSLIGNFH